MQSQIPESAHPVAGASNAVAPGPRGLPVVGSLNRLWRKDMIQFYQDVWREYGDVVRFRLGPMDAFLIAHPDDVKHVLVDNEKNYWKGRALRKLRLVLGEGLFTSEGSLWRRQRRVMQPTFTPRSVTRFVPAMTAAVQDMISAWQPYALRGEALEMNGEMMRLAMAVIAQTMLSKDFSGESARAGRAFTQVLDFVSSRSVTLLDMPLWVPTPVHRHFKQGLAVLDDFIYGMIRERRAQQEGTLRSTDAAREMPQDLLTTLLQARDPESGAPMSERQLHDEVLTIFFAGHETTAQALTWAWYLLSAHPDAEAKLRAEVDSVLGTRVPVAEDLERLVYTRMVVDEAMRLYPPVWVFVREALGDDELGGYHIPQGSMILLSQYITHRHPAMWQEPEKFDPMRFAPERAEKRPRYAYFPFGGGPRICLGNSFALQEAALALAMVSQHYRLRLVPGAEIKPRMRGTLRPDGPVLMTVERR